MRFRIWSVAVSRVVNDFPSGMTLLFTMVSPEISPRRSPYIRNLLKQQYNGLNFAGLPRPHFINSL